MPGQKLEAQTVDQVPLTRSENNFRGELLEPLVGESMSHDFRFVEVHASSACAPFFEKRLTAGIPGRAALISFNSD